MCVDGMITFQIAPDKWQIIEKNAKWWFIQYNFLRNVAHSKNSDYICKSLNQTFIHTIFS